MTATTNLRFGINNQIPNMTLSATPAPVTDINHLKNEYAARMAVWTDADATTTITGVLDEVQYGDFFVMAGANLVGTAQTTLTLYNDGATQSSVVFDNGTVNLAEFPPAGEFRAGIDAWGVPRQLDNPEVFVIWFDKTYQYNSFKLEISNPAILPAEILDIRIRMLMLGEKYEIERDFDNSEITFLTPPELVQTASGKWLPSRAQQKSRTLSIDFNHMTDTDRSLLWQTEATLNNEAFLISAYPGESGFRYINYNFLGRLANSLTYSHRYRGGNGVNNLTVVEV